MRISYMSDGKGNCVYQNKEDNCLTVVDKWIYTHHCTNCGTDTSKMKTIKETGYYEKEVVSKCKCGTIVKYNG